MRAWPPKVIRSAPRPTAFLDRDGTINRDRAGVYITSPSQLSLYAAAPRAVKIIAAKGYRVVVLTNQSAVGRGYMTLAASLAVNRRMLSLLKKAGAAVDAVYFCPHAPGQDCACRKPKPGLIREALKDSPADLRRSFMAGDKNSDLLMARSAGIKGFPVLTGQWRTSLPPSAARTGYRDLLALARALPDLSGNTTKRKTK